MLGLKESGVDFVAANAALVRSEMRSASSSATMAMMPTVSRFAFGMSACQRLPLRDGSQVKDRHPRSAVEAGGDRLRPPFWRRSREKVRLLVRCG